MRSLSEPSMNSSRNAIDARYTSQFSPKSRHRFSRSGSAVALLGLPSNIWKATPMVACDDATPRSRNPNASPPKFSLNFRPTEYVLRDIKNHVLHRTFDGLSKRGSNLGAPDLCEFRFLQSLSIVAQGRGLSKPFAFQTYCPRCSTPDRKRSTKISCRITAKSGRLAC